MTDREQELRELVEELSVRYAKLMEAFKNNIPPSKDEDEQS